MSTPPSSTPGIELATPRTALPCAQLEARWGDATLAAELVDLGRAGRARVLTAIGPVALPQVIELARGADGAARLRVAGGEWSVGGPDAPAELDLGGLVVRASLAARERVGSRATPDAASAAVALASLLVHAALATALVATSRDARPARGDELAALRALVARATHTRVPPPRVVPVAPAAASTEALDALPDTRTRDELPRAHRPLRGALPPAAVVASRGVLGAIWTPALRRAVARSRDAFASMTRDGGAIDPGPTDRQTFGHLGGAGVGAGRGCSSPEECATVAVGAVHEDTGWGARGAVAAAEPLQQRASAPPALAPPPPVAGELTMEYVRRIVRRELLAGVQRCYSDRLAEASTLESGRVVVRFAVGTDGRVSNTTIVASAIRDEATERCITRLIDGFAFPASNGGAEVTYPFVFSSLMPDR